MCTRVKLCGLKSLKDIEIVNRLKPEYVGFVMWEKSHRNVSRETLSVLKDALNSDIKAVGVFVDEEPETIAALINDRLIDVAQLHGNEDNNYIQKLKSMISGDTTVIKAFKVDEDNVKKSIDSLADIVLFDPGKGDGMTFSWEILKGYDRPYFLAGGLTPENVSKAIELLKPYAVDVSSGIETDKVKDEIKATAFVNAVRNK